MIIVISNELVYQDPTAQYFMISFFLFFKIHELGGLATFQKRAQPNLATGQRGKQKSLGILLHVNNMGLFFQKSPLYHSQPLSSCHQDEFSPKTNSLFMMAYLRQVNLPHSTSDNQLCPIHQKCRLSLIACSFYAQEFQVIFGEQTFWNNSQSNVKDAATGFLQIFKENLRIFIIV